MAKKDFVSLLFCIWASSNVFSQVGVTAYFGNVLEVNTSKQKMISGGLKVALNNTLFDTSFELFGMYNLKAADYHRFSMGVGVMLAPFQDRDAYRGISIPVQLEVFPLQNFRRLSFVTEVAPQWTTDSEAAFRYLVGIRYTF
ncbi:MAG: hypothetical protein LBB73_00325 [Dysgonamonadaceae bacterium]|jgi:hypothetical protein|nr:hypothetical protein [Dysgonamonadaceae bacterium]